MWKPELKNTTLRGNSGRDSWEWGWEKAFRSPRNQGRIETWNWMPEEFQRPRSPVVPEPGCTSGLPGEMLEVQLYPEGKLTECRMWYEETSGWCTGISIFENISGDSDLHPGWNIIDRVIGAEVTACKVAEVPGFGSESSFTRGVPKRPDGIRLRTRSDEMEAANVGCLFWKSLSKDLGVKGTLWWEKVKVKRIFSAVVTCKFVGRE